MQTRHSKQQCLEQTNGECPSAKMTKIWFQQVKVYNILLTITKTRPAGKVYCLKEETTVINRPRNSPDPDNAGPIAPHCNLARTLTVGPYSAAP